MKILSREKISPIFLAPGDSISLTYHPPGGTTKRELLRETVGRSMVVNETVLFDCDEEFGWDDGIGGAFGHAKEAPPPRVETRGRG